jgi:four helix bundle protein
MRQFRRKSLLMFVHHRHSTTQLEKLRSGEHMSSSFRELRVWQEAIDLTTEIYKETAQFPKHETYGLIQQIRRAAISIASNIAEGKGHRSDKEFLHFLFHARGSLLEVQTQLIIAEKLNYLSDSGLRLQIRANDIGRALSGLITSLERKVA